MDLVDFIVVQSQCLGEVERAIEDFLYDCYDREFEVMDLICNSAIKYLKYFIFPSCQTSALYRCFEHFS